MSWMRRHRVRLGLAALGAVLATGAGVATAAAASPPPSNAVVPGTGVGEYGMTSAFYDGHIVHFTYSRGFYCDLHVSSGASSGCEVGANYVVPPSKSFDPLYIAVPIGISVPAMSMDCPSGLVCVDHPGTIDLSRLEPALKPLYPNLSAAQLTAALKNVPTPGHEHFITTVNDRKPEWWDVKVIGVEKLSVWNAINRHRSFAFLEKEVRAGQTTPIIPTNLFLYFSVN
ncbi:hypothetical protein Afer_0095 [Acidimicrobium ferrooxidans DSM 10331]|uniref:Uncharacterized protein n=1 Tax=Acidimicrobium ferrooxidans (strain DSM 10331 / JCM 15462 / NBRC 103882 / ICP) TaxID=525909 RepID=C7M1L7_ACIFD|nr:hypothetical protein [Acidimicrobium ferrooxidans]ACU53066.1 hypothetical protein Afer_0095 [Acidimicrobium ferrooxidans DSM 10331]